MSELSTRDWKEFKAWLRQRARASDARDAFTGQYTASRLTAHQGIEIYQAGREGRIPACWEPLYKEWQQTTQNPEYLLYLKLQLKYGQSPATPKKRKL